MVSTPTDWQKDDQIVVTQDDLYAITWETNFGDTPFDNVSKGDQTHEGVENNGDITDNDITNVTMPPPELVVTNPEPDVTLNSDVTSAETEESTAS